LSEVTEIKKEVQPFEGPVMRDAEEDEDRDHEHIPVMEVMGMSHDDEFTQDQVQHPKCESKFIDGTSYRGFSDA